MTCLGFLLLITVAVCYTAARCYEEVVNLRSLSAQGVREYVVYGVGVSMSGRMVGPTF